MATKYPKQRSPFWWIQFVDKDGVRRNQSSGLRRDNPKDTAEADIVVAKMTAAEVSRGMHGGNIEPKWEWVPKFFSDRYGKNKTHNIYKNRWSWIALFLAEKKIRSPDQITFDHGQEYVDWRTAYKKKSGRGVCRNTAILEIKLISLVVQQAVRMKLCNSNPLTKLGISKDDPDEKPEITDTEYAKIDAALNEEPEWMRISWEIAKHTGCRMNDTVIPMNNLDFQKCTITFAQPKGGRKRAFSIAMPDALKPLLQSIKKSGRTYTLELPFQPSRQWQHFFRRVKLPHIVFHCTRVTYITRLARGGVPLSAAMRMVNHASTTIHRVYQRLNVEDVRQYANLVFQNAAVATNDNPQEKQSLLE